MYFHIQRQIFRGNIKNGDQLFSEMIMNIDFKAAPFDFLNLIMHLYAHKIVFLPE